MCDVFICKPSGSRAFNVCVCVKAHTFSKCISRSKIIFDSIISVRIMDVRRGTTKRMVFPLESIRQRDDGTLCGNHTSNYDG